ncbi:helix-turn-helix domain-containing protein [Moorella sp. Hama-1]|uniref:helix-turn-helix domain-containing protein n=1 Tax=Moorella sp. Hama-1 TaxID=2138101 RepID=UPI000D6548D3|nr:helix-turn-helix transcriptional regulator [Moorella sp. Hama-1]BCV20425.1 transcriptional regulator [Moorella sp. Hama-1]
MDDIGIRLKHLRIKKGLTLRALAKAAHISHSFIADIESGRSKPSLDTSKALAKALGVSLIDLTGDVYDITSDITGKGLDIHESEEDWRTKPIDTREWYNRDDPPSNIELEEFLRQSNVQFNGAPLDEEDKEDIIEFLKFAWKTLKKEKEKG